jgi:hypothetical protein
MQLHQCPHQQLLLNYLEQGCTAAGIRSKCRAPQNLIPVAGEVPAIQLQGLLRTRQQVDLPIVCAWLEIPTLLPSLLS